MRDSACMHVFYIDDIEDKILGRLVKTMLAQHLLYINEEHVLAGANHVGEKGSKRDGVASCFSMAAQNRLSFTPVRFQMYLVL